jgi:hypothetical protein
MSINDLGGITTLGHRQMLDLGVRYGKRLSKFIQNIDPSEIRIQTVDENRTKDSAMEYATGMLGVLGSNGLKMYANNEDDDFLLEYFHVCKKFIKVIFLIFHFQKD